MTDAHLAPVLRHLRRLAGRSSTEDVPDAILLSQLVSHKDSAAFEALVRRHGPLVWRVCRRVLHREPDAEDAFQATFLALARQAASIRKPGSLASFLHGTAYRIARRARANDERRRSVEGEHVTVADADPTREVVWRELGIILEEEVHALPEKLRAALLLCYWEGLTNEEAAQRLGWPCGTVKTRLAKAREWLSVRLTRRGVTLPAGVAALLLAPGAGDAAVPTILLAAVREIHRGPIGASPRVAALTEQALRYGALGKVRIGLLLLAVGAVSAGVGVLSRLAPVAVQPAAATEKGTPNVTPRPAKEQPPAQGDLQGDPLPAGAVTRLGTVRFRMGGLVYACAWSPDGKTLAASSDGNIIHLFDAAIGKPIRRLGGGGFNALSLAWSPNGKTLASGSTDTTIRIWAPATGEMLRQFRAVQPVWSLAFTRDGKSLISGVGEQVSGGKDSLVLLWDPATGKELRRFTGHQKAVRCVALSPDGQTIASTGGEIRLWEMASGKMIRQFAGQKEPIRSLALSPDGKLLATGSGDDLTVWLWEMSTGKVLRRLPEDRKELRMLGSGCVRSLAFSPDGKTLAIGGADHSLRLRNLATGKKLREVSGVGSITYRGWHDGGIQCVAFSPDGRRLAFVQDNRLALLDVQSGKEILPFPGHAGAVQQVLFDPDGKRLITVSDDPNRQLLEWDSASGQMIRQIPGKVPWAHLATFSPNRKILASTGDGSALHLWDTTTGQELRRIPLPFKAPFKSPGAVVFSPDGKLLAVADPEGEAVWLMDATTGKQVCGLEKMGGSAGFTPLIFSSDGRQLAAASYTAIHLAEVPSGRQSLRIAMPKDHYLSALAVSPDGRTLATPRSITFKHTIALWEAATGKERLTLPVSHPGGFKTVAFSPDGRLLAAGNDAGLVLLWDTVAGKQVSRLEGHQSEITSLAFSTDGRRLASGSLDTTALIWDVTRLPRARRRATPLAGKELEVLWTTLADDDAAQAYQAILSLESSPEQTVPLLTERLRPRPVPDAERVARLLIQLDSAQFSERERAMDALRKLGWATEPALLKALESKPSLELRKRVKELLDDIRKKEVPPALLQILRGMEVLERIGTPAARHVLERLADGVAEARLTHEAKASLERLSKRPTAP